jgi:hypothetical protein
VSATTPDRIDQLYAVPLPDFVKARDRLAAELRKQGDKPAAAEVKALVKPTLAAWALNQAARASPSGVKDLLETSDRMARLQLRAGADADSRRRFDEASAEHRRLVAELLTRAEKALESAGHAANPVTLERVANNLRWGALDEDARPLLAGGRLVQDLAPQGFGAFVPAEPADGEATIDLHRGRPTIVQAAPSPLGSKPGPGVAARAPSGNRAAAPPGAAGAAVPSRNGTLRSPPRAEVGILRAELREADRRVNQARRDLERRVEAARAAELALAELERRTESAREAARLAVEERSQAESALAGEEAAQQAAAASVETALASFAEAGGPGREHGRKRKS